jgi:hypothetical protein
MRHRTPRPLSHASFCFPAHPFFTHYPHTSHTTSLLFGLEFSSRTHCGNAPPRPPVVHRMKSSATSRVLSCTPARVVDPCVAQSGRATSMWGLRESTRAGKAGRRAGAIGAERREEGAKSEEKCPRREESEGDIGEGVQGREEASSGNRWRIDGEREGGTSRRTATRP